ncbi:MAG: DUF2971 domain-containing protein [Spirochaetaceae bacterium]
MSDQYLYKYRPLFTTDKDNNYKVNEFTDALITKGELYFSNPNDFNDPFDSQFVFESHYKPSEAIEYFENSPYEEKYGVKLVGIGAFNYDKFIKNITAVTDGFRVLCLSKDPKNILMWSHYAYNHTGICVGIKSEVRKDLIAINVKTNTSVHNKKNHELDNGSLIAKAIYYPKNDLVPHILNPFKDNSGKVKDILYSKSSLWSYEEEYRIILPLHNIPTKKVYLIEGSIGQIIFGLKVPYDLKKHIIGKLSDRNDDITFLETKKIHGKYELELVEVTI